LIALPRLIANWRGRHISQSKFVDNLLNTLCPRHEIFHLRAQRLIMDVACQRDRPIYGRRLNVL
jgi:hypothetical protein